MANELLGADKRPRVHIWMGPGGEGDIRWRIGPQGLVQRSETVGGAVLAALILLNAQDTVIFWEGQKA